MATPEQILELRRLVDEPTQDPYTDAVLSLRIDEAATLRSLAGDIWREKAATLAGLADVREGNSSRSLSQLYKQALTMADSFDADVTAEAVSARRVIRTRPIERP